MRIMWGTYPDDDGDVHVIPCDEEGYFMQPHKADIECACNPKRVYGNVIVHEIIQ